MVGDLAPKRPPCATLRWKASFATWQWKASYATERWKSVIRESGWSTGVRVARQRRSPETPATRCSVAVRVFRPRERGPRAGNGAAHYRVRGAPERNASQARAVTTVAGEDGALTRPGFIEGAGGRHTAAQLVFPGPCRTTPSQADANVRRLLRVTRLGSRHLWCSRLPGTNHLPKRERRVAAALVCAILAAMIAPAIPGNARSSSHARSHSVTEARACANLGRYVSVGGTAGFNALVNPDFTTALLASGHVRLYEHATAIATAITDGPPSKPYAILSAIESVFGGTGPGEAELGLLGSNYFTLPASGYPGYYQYQFVNSGLSPDAANVNVPYRPASAIKFDRKNVQAWEAWVQAGKSVGIASMAPVIAPNAAWKRGSPIFPPTRREYYDLNSSFYDLARFEALYGGGIALDTPSDFFLEGGSGPGYQRFIEQAIRWGTAHGLRTTVLVSPYATRRSFTEDTEKFVRMLLASRAVPTEWAVDDYEVTRPNDAKAMGPDTHRNTTTEVGLWLADHAPVYVPTSENRTLVGGTICRPAPSQSIPRTAYSSPS